MAAKKKAKKKTKSAPPVTRKMARVGNEAMKRKVPKKPIRKKQARTKVAVKRRVTDKTSTAKARSTSTERKSRTPDAAFVEVRATASSGGQSGDLQGLSRAAQADSESVDELISEGNPFEAEAVAGVEDADNADQREVHTHEVPEDDVPDEYLDKD
jgi:N utilization substance protein A